MARRSELFKRVQKLYLRKKQEGEAVKTGTQTTGDGRRTKPVWGVHLGDEMAIYYYPPLTTFDEVYYIVQRTADESVKIRDSGVFDADDTEAAQQLIEEVLDANEG